MVEVEHSFERTQVENMKALLKHCLTAQALEALQPMGCLSLLPLLKG
jgi:hypothetical protein